MTELNKLCSYYEETCALAAARCSGLILAIEDGYGYESRPATSIFLNVDAVSAHNPACTFKNDALDTLLDDLPLPTVGTIDPSDDVDAETWAIRLGYARDRVMAYAECKAGLLKSSSVDTNDECAATLRALPERVKDALRQCEELVVGSAPDDRPAPVLVHGDKRVEWNDSGLQQPTLRQDRAVYGTPLSAIGASASELAVARDPAVQSTERDAKVGTERFISIVFPPSSHAILVAANAKEGGVSIAESVKAYPAYVTVHNSKGAIENLPATATEPHPNSVMVPDAASLLYDLHSLSTRCGRDPLLMTHEIRT